ncbi:phage gp6-like head-tail connector protein [Streptomyces niveus]|uniref:phage gp6-like head-tail connector protein n=1 Tax=Streptomyces niveus TaxID=193462 RepID=UPI0033D1DFD2
MALVSVGDVTVRLGWPLSPEEEARVEAFIEDCTVLVEDYCGRDFVRREDEAFQLVTDIGCWLPIPRRFLPYLTVTSAAYEGEDPLEGWEYSSGGIYLYPGWLPGKVVTLTGSWGYTNPPAVLKTAITAEVIRWMAQTPGLAMERTGEREVEYATASSPQSLSMAAEQALRRYRPSAGTITLHRRGI